MWIGEQVENLKVGDQIVINVRHPFGKEPYCKTEVYKVTKTQISAYVNGQLERFMKSNLAEVGNRWHGDSIATFNPLTGPEKLLTWDDADERNKKIKADNERQRLLGTLKRAINQDYGLNKLSDAQLKTLQEWMGMENV